MDDIWKLKFPGRRDATRLDHSTRIPAGISASHIRSLETPTTDPAIQQQHLPQTKHLYNIYNVTIYRSWPLLPDRRLGIDTRAQSCQVRKQERRPDCALVQDSQYHGRPVLAVFNIYSRGGGMCTQGERRSRYGRLIIRAQKTSNRTAD